MQLTDVLPTKMKHLRKTLQVHKTSTFHYNELLDVYFIRVLGKNPPPGKKSPRLKSNPIPNLPLPLTGSFFPGGFFPDTFIRFYKTELNLETVCITSEKIVYMKD